MSSPFATPKKPATDALLHPPGSAVGIAIAAANEAQGKDGLDSVHAKTRQFDVDELGEGSPGSHREAKARHGLMWDFCRVAAVLLK